MKDIELECMPTWRYCTVRDGEKIPFPAGWQNNALELSQVHTSNLGLLLGPKSHGVVALDFDGASAWTWFDQTFDIEIPATIAWTSGKDARCQMAFSVPIDYWPLLRTQKIATGDHEGFEFRWDRTQSIMPPSGLHDGRRYAWIHAPSTINLAPMPQVILDWWVLKCNPEPAPVVVYSPITNQQADDLARQLKNLYPTLEYDTWSHVTWGFCNTIGYGDGIQLMKQYWPEQKPGEYAILGNKAPMGKKYTLGTIKKMISDSRGRKVQKPLPSNHYQMQLAREIEQLEYEINRRKQHG